MTYGPQGFKKISENFIVGKIATKTILKEEKNLNFSLVITKSASTDKIISSI